MDISEPYEIEEDIKAMSEKELSSVNKSNPDDRVVERSRIIRPKPPIPKVKQTPSYLYSSEGGNLASKHVPRPPQHQPTTKREYDSFSHSKQPDELKQRLQVSPVPDHHGSATEGKLRDAVSVNSGKKVIGVSFDESGGLKSSKNSWAANSPKSGSVSYHLRAQFSHTDTNQNYGDSGQNLRREPSPGFGRDAGAQPWPPDNSRFQKLADKIRSQAKRIIEQERKIEGLNRQVDDLLAEKKKLMSEVKEAKEEASASVSIAKNNLNQSNGPPGTGANSSLQVSNLSSRRASRREISMLKSKLKSFNDENKELRARLQNLVNEAEATKRGLIKQLARSDEEEGYLLRISELEDVLKQECVKNEKLDAMVDLLRRLNEEKLETAGFTPIEGMSRVDSIIDAMHVYDNNEKLIDEMGGLKQRVEELEGENEELRELLSGLHAKNKSLFEYKVKADQSVLEVRRQELELTEKVEVLQGKLMEVLQLNDASETNLDQSEFKLRCYKNALSQFSEASTQLSEALSIINTDLIIPIYSGSLIPSPDKLQDIVDRFSHLNTEFENFKTQIFAYLRRMVLSSLSKLKSEKQILGHPQGVENGPESAIKIENEEETEDLESLDFGLKFEDKITELKSAIKGLPFTDSDRFERESLRRLVNPPAAPEQYFGQGQDLDLEVAEADLSSHENLHQN